MTDTPCSVYRAGMIAGQSWRAQRPDIPKVSYDVAIIVSSWDERCCSLLNQNLVAESLIVILFDEKDTLGLRDRHDPLLMDQAMRSKSELSVISGSSFDLTQVWRKLRRVLADLYARKQKPLRVFLDITTCPRFLSLATIAMCLDSGLARNVTLFYSEGFYDTPDNLSKVVFKSGEWRSIGIPGLMGHYDPGLSKFYLASIGFEGSKTYRVVARADPDRVAVLLPDPGFRPDYPAVTRRNNRMLLEDFVGPKGSIVSAHAGDAIGGWKALADARIERSGEENTYFLCSGTKPHSVALALRALELRTPAVIYNAPEKYESIPVRPSGVYWRYELEAIGIPTG